MVIYDHVTAAGRDDVTPPLVLVGGRGWKPGSAAPGTGGDAVLSVSVSGTDG